MSILCEKKISTKERNDLKTSSFGLPKERKYPLNDEAHVRKAIQFFKYCEPTKRNELALNINKKIKEYNMDVTVSKDSPFAKYANKNIVTIKEASCNDYIDESIRDNMEFVTNYNISSYHDMINLESYCKVIIDEELERCVLKKRHTPLIESINKHLKNEYNDFIEFCNENSSIYNLVEEAKNELIESADDIESFHKKLPVFKGIIESTNNKWHIYRVLSEAVTSLTSKMDTMEDDMNASAMIGFIKDIDSMKNTVECSVDIPSNERQLIVTESSTIFGYPEEWYNTKCMNISLDCERNKINDDINSINSEFNTIIPDELGLGFTPLRDIAIFPDKVKCISCKLTANLDSDDCLFVSRYINTTNGRIIDKLYDDNFTGTKLRYAYSTKNKKHYLIAKMENTSVYDIVLVELNDDVINYLSGITPDYDKPTIHVIRIRDNISTTNDNIAESVKEAFDISEDGDIKITISPKNSYMDSYSANHKMLAENWKNRNYDAMKKNLAYVFALISVIERDTGYKNKDPEIMKARAFAINDFKSYLKKLQSVEPDFDFVEYYQKSDYDKKIINVPKSTIIGIKKLMHAIII